MQIQLYDRGSPQGKQLFTNIKTICQRLQIEEDPEYIQDMKRVYAQGIQGKTVLIFDREVDRGDKYPPISELEKIISEYYRQ